MQKSLAKNSIYNIIYTGGNIIFPFLTSIYVSRVLLPAGVGTVAYAQNIASYFVTLGALGLSSYGVREFAKVRECDKKRNKLFTELFSLNLISTSIAVIGYILLVCINNGFNGEWYLYIACGLTVFFNYINIDWLYQGMEEYGYITARSLLVKTCSFLAILLLVKTKQDYVIYALISSFGTGANYLFNVFHARAFIRFDFTELRIKRHLKSVFTIFLIIFLSTIYAKIDTTMLGAMATEESVGYYTYAQKTVTVLLALEVIVGSVVYVVLNILMKNQLMLEVINMTKQRIHNATKKRI